MSPPGNLYNACGMQIERAVTWADMESGWIEYITDGVDVSDKCDLLFVVRTEQHNPPLRFVPRGQ